MSGENKFKVGILSMQRIFNYGSFLQGYGLKSILTELGCDVQFVDYHPGKCLVDSQEKTGILRKLSKAAEVLRYKAPLPEKLKFIKYKKNYAANYFPLLGIDENMNYSPELDLLVIGSDEVFNCVQDNTNVGFSPELFGNGQKAKSIISYAASFGNTTIEKLENYHVDGTVGEWLGKFDAISVRDANSGKIVKKLLAKEPVYNLDPVLAYDYAGKCSRIPDSVPESGYIILYGYSGRFSAKECAKIRKIADKRNLKVFCIGGVQDCCDKFIDCDPFKVIAYFQHADAVITDTFHGSILSVITHRNFVSIIRSSGYGNAEKLSDLLLRLKRTDRRLKRLSELEELLFTPVDYTETDRIIAHERKRTYDYLSRFIQRGRNED